MTHYLLAALGVALAAAVAFSAIQSARLSAVQGQLAGLQEDLAEAEAERDRAVAGAAELERFAREQRNRDRDERATIDRLKTGDFTDADTPLDPELSRILECLRSGSVDCGLSSALPD